MSDCKFNRAWIGPCGKPCGGNYCEEHTGVKCVVTGKQATHECNHTGQFVCGFPLSNDAQHGTRPGVFHELTEAAARRGLDGLDLSVPGLAETQHGTVRR